MILHIKIEKKRLDFLGDLSVNEKTKAEADDEITGFFFFLRGGGLPCAEL